MNITTYMYDVSYVFVYYKAGLMTDPNPTSQPKNGLKYEQGFFLQQIFGIYLW